MFRRPRKHLASLMRMYVQEAQEASRVILPEAPDLVSHAGFMTVNKLFNSNLFFWFFPAAFKALSHEI